MLAFIIKALYMGYSDFAAYYFGSKLLLAQNYHTAYDTSSLNIFIQDLGYKNLYVSYTPFPPFTSVFFAPFTLLPIDLAKIIFNSLSCLLFAIFLYRSIRHFSLSPVVMLIIPLIFFTPIRSNIYFGQSYLLLFCLLIEGYIAFEKKQALLSSILWGVAILFKIFPVLIFLFLLLRKEYKAIGYLIVICTILLSVSLVINGFESWNFYLMELFPRLNNGELNDSYTYLFQSAFMLFKNLFIYDDILNPVAALPNVYLFWLSLVAFKTFIVSSCVIVTIKEKQHPFLCFSLWIFASLLISPNGSTYSQIVLLLPLLALFRLDIPLSHKIIPALLVLLICNVPVHYFANLPLLLKFPRLYFLLAFFIAILALLKFRPDYKIISGAVILFLLLELPRTFRKEDDSSYFLQDHKHLMICDYIVKDQHIERLYWSEEGSKTDTVTFVAGHHSTNDLAMRDQQIYYKNRQITETKDWKRKPVLIDHAYIIYLSDQNRGIGFYTLRKIKLPQTSK
jgi:hypothetical protein